MTVDVNCDMGEGFGLYKLGEDEALMPFISEANIACGFHASDPNHMQKTVALAKKYNVKAGAHFSYPDLTGFGRREMKINRADMTNIIIYQVGALKGFLDFAGLKLNHLKPHGALYSVSARDENIALAIADVAKYFAVPVLGQSGTMHEKIYAEQGVEFRAEFFADLDYDGAGNLIVTQNHDAPVPADAAKRVLRAVEEGKVTATNGKDITVKVDTICIHSDTPNAVALAQIISRTLKSYLAEK